MKRSKNVSANIQLRYTVAHISLFLTHETAKEEVNKHDQTLITKKQRKGNN